MKQVYFLRALLSVFFIGVSSMSIQAHTIDRHLPVKREHLLDRPTAPPPVYGPITIVASGGDSEGSTWSYSSGSIAPLNSTAVNLNVSDVLAKLALGNLTIATTSININAAINNTANANRITFKASDDILVAANISITTNGGDVIFWANSNVSGNGSITLSDSTTINTVNGSTASGLTGGGRIVLAGGADDGSNGGVASDSIPDGLATSSITDGVKLGTTNTNITLMYSGGGDIIIRGNGSLSGGIFSDRSGVFQFGRWTANAGKGVITIAGTSTYFYGINFVEPSVNTNTGDKHLVLISDKGTGDAIQITGSSTSSYGVVFNYNNPKEVLATGGGNISITGTAGGDKGVFLQNQDLLASAGSITVDGGALGVRITENGARIGAKTGTAITSSSADIVLRGNVFNFDIPASITSTGKLTLQPFGTSFSSTLTWPNSNLTVTGITGLTLGKPGNTSDINFGSATSISGPINVYAANINVNDNLIANAGNGIGDILLKATGNIALAGSKTITTNGGDVILWADSDSSGTATSAGGTVSLNASSSIASGGGNIVMAGGGDSNTDGIPDGFAIGQGSNNGGTAGLYLDNASLFAGTGNVLLRGQGTGDGVNFQMGTRLYGGFIYAADITIDGKGSVRGNSSSNWGLSLEGFYIEGSGAITLNGWGGRSDSIYNNADANQVGVLINFQSKIRATGSGSITINGIGGSGPNAAYNDNATGIFIQAGQTNPIVSANGAITLNGTSGYSGGVDGNSPALLIGSPIVSTTGNITLKGNASIAGTLNKSGNIKINATITAGADLKIESPGTVTQTAAINADGLALLGTGTFTLTNSSNLVSTIAAGDNTTKLDSLAYAQTGNLTIGQVNPTGIHASGTIDVSTVTGNITIEQDISCDTTSSDAIVINAGKSKSAGDATGGNIIISGTPAITAGTGATIKLFSGSKEVSKGLRSFVSDAAYQRFSVDETSTYDPVLTAAGTYALYRGEKPDNSLHFDGVDDYVNVTEKTFGSVTTAITLEAWIYAQNNTKLLQGIFVKAKGGGSADCNYGLRVFNKKIVLNVGNGTQSYAVVTDDTIPLNTWVHVAGSFQQGSSGKMYINGQRVSATPILFDSTLTFGDLSGTASHIGDYPYPGYDQYFQGKIDEVRVWNVVRSQAEIGSGYCGPLTGTETGLLAYYDFKQGVAGGDNTAIDSLFDVTSGGNNGGLNNFTRNGSTSNFVESDRFADAGTISGSQSVSVGGTITLTVSGNSATGTWGSNSPSVATVDSSGLVTGLSVGTDSVYYVVAAPGGCTGTDTSFYAITVSPDISLHFDGADDYVNVNENSLDSVTNALTLEAWIYPENNSKDRQGIFVKSRDSYLGVDCNYGLRYYNTTINNVYSRSIVLQVGNGSQSYELATSDPIPQNEWVHVAATFESGVGGKIYINGNQVSTSLISSDNKSLTIGNLSNTRTYIGNYPIDGLDNYFQGKIDEIRVWNVVRTLQDFNSNRCGTLSGTETGLLAYYDFNQGVAGGDNTAIDSVFDVTSGANNGGLNNFTLNGSTSNFVESGRVPDAGTISGSTSACVAGTITLSVTGNSAKGTWGSTRTSVATVDTSGVVTGLSAGTDSVYYVVAGPGGCYGTDTAFYAITVDPKTVITAEPVGATLSTNATTTLSVTAEGTGIHYAWYSKADSSYYNPTPATPDDTTASYTPPAQSVINTTYYYVIVTGDCGSDTSRIVGVRTLGTAEFDANVSIHSKHAGIYSDTVWVRARLVDASSKRAIQGGTVTFTIYNGDDPGIGTANSNRVQAITDDKGFARSYILITQDPDWTDSLNDNNGDSMHIRAYFAGDGTYASSEQVESFNVKAEAAEFEVLGTDPSNPEPGLADANKIKFNGKLGSGYIETPNNTVDVTVTVKIQEKPDDYPGDITKANVRFELSPSGGSSSSIIDKRPDGDGNVSVTFNSVPVGSYGSNSFTVHVTAGDYYRARLNSTLTLHKKGVASLFCGGGDIQIASSTGKYAGDPGTVASFSVGSKYNKTASKVQGAASLIFTSNGRTYEVKGSGTPTVTFDSVAGVASYISAASIADITLDSSGTVSTIISPTSLTMAYNLKDSTTDLVSIKVADATSVWFANQGTGSVTDRQILIRGGMAITFNIAAPTANSATRCGPGTVTLTATPPSGATVDWYDAPTGGTKMMAGATSFTVNAATNVTYYAEARNTTTNALSATRTPATVTINAQPEVPAVSSGSRCGTGTVLLNATTPANTTIAWYSAASGGKALSTASSYTTPSISVTTNYYAETKSTVNGCTSATRAVATATVNALPTAPVTTSAASCGPGTVILGATTAQSGKQIEWYTASKGGSSFNVGTTYTIANLTATTTYYTLSKDVATGCASSTRTAVTATLSSNPAAPASVSGTVSNCPSSTTALTFTAAKVTGASSYQWTKPSCATGSSTTNSISLAFSSAGANDYVAVKAVNAYGCVSASKAVPVTTATTCSACTTGSTATSTGEVVTRISNTSAAQLEVYPNPNKGRFNLSLRGFDAGNALVRIVNINGTVIYSRPYNLMEGRNILPLTIQKANQGLFLVQVIQNGKVKTIKLKTE